MIRELIDTDLEAVVGGVTQTLTQTNDISQTAHAGKGGSATNAIGVVGNSAEQLASVTSLRFPFPLFAL